VIVFQVLGIALISGLVLTILCAMIYTPVEQNQHLLWPRGLRWFTPVFLGLGYALHRTLVRIFWPERTWELKSPAVRRLERVDAEWRQASLSSVGYVPQWHAWPSGRGGAWKVRRAERAACPCGFYSECAVWCGAGHTDGRCAEHDGIICVEIDGMIVNRPSNPGVRYER
jgi:hypothetical protein